MKTVFILRRAVQLKLRLSSPPSMPPLPPHALARRPCLVRRQCGATLLVTLFMLIALLMLGASVSQIVLQAERSARIDRDRKIAFHAAEAALRDAEADIGGWAAGPAVRSAQFGRGDGELFGGACGAGAGNARLGLCGDTADEAAAPWLSVDFLDDDAASGASVPYGRFTGAAMQSGAASLPVRPPRYVIERVRLKSAGRDAGIDGDAGAIYRITAIGFGTRLATQAVLQSFYRKPPERI